MRGKVISFLRRPGWGFIRPEGAGVEDDVFFHWSALRGVDSRQVGPDMPVMFEVGEHKGKPCAVNVTPVAQPGVPGPVATDAGAR